MKRTTLGIRVGAVAFMLGALGGCSHPRVGTVEATLATPATSDLMTTADVEALRKVTAARAMAPAVEGYRIGPDDLLDIRIPDLIDAQAPMGGRGSSSSVGAAQVVGGAPAYQQG